MKPKNGKTMAKSKVTAKPQSLGESFAANLRRYRERMDVSQAGLGARARVTTGHVSMLERGIRQPSFAVIERLAGALNVRDPRKMLAAR